MKRGEVWWVAFDPAVGSEIRKTRPAVMVRNDAANRRLARVIVVPLTSSALASVAKSIHSQGSSARLRRPGLWSLFFCFPGEHIASGKENGMDTELVQLAREAVTALQLQAAAAGSTRWVEVAQLVISGAGLAAILIGLVRMKEAGARRDREIDELGKGLQQQGQALERQGAAMTQAFTQQGQALERQGEAMTKALTQQGEVLAELLRRTA